jgi:hypothetical protein
MNLGFVYKNSYTVIIYEFYMTTTTRHRQPLHRHRWSMKYKRSINCRRPRGFSQRQHCKYGRRGWRTTQRFSKANKLK